MKFEIEEKRNTTIVIDKHMPKDEIKLKEVSGKMYKYELPVVNEAIVFKSKQALITQEESKEVLTIT